MSSLEYNNYCGSAEFDMDRKVLWGKILFIDDLVTYEAADIPSLEAEFRLAVDDYIETCREIGKVPQKPLKGVFQVRIPPDRHKEALIRARRDGTSLNDVVSKALTSYLCSDLNINHKHTHQVVISTSNVTEPHMFNVGTLPAKQWSQAKH